MTDDNLDENSHESLNDCYMRALLLYERGIEVEHNNINQYHFVMVGLSFMVINHDLK